jgi:pyruvate dehydrogenase E2 component (dihydrolipoamide acetyltransferase)
MALEILMPKLGLTMKTGTVVKWLREEGDAVREKDPVLEIETEKLSYTIESPGDGVLLKKIAEVGEKYPIAFVVGYVGAAGEEIPETETADAKHDVPATSTEDAFPAKADVPKVAETFPTDPKQGQRIFISPVAKKLAAEMKIDYRQIPGTGPNGRIVKADVLRYAETRPASQLTTSAIPDETIPYIGMRRAIGENMLQAWLTIPMVTHHVMAKADDLLAYRRMINRGVQDKSDRISINDLLIKIVAIALRKTPMMNSSLAGGEIILHGHVHVGMATALEKGLIVPVIRDADKKNLLELSREAKDLAFRARNGSLEPDDLQGATFTVSNLGGYSSVDFFSPIINPPQAAILGVGRVKEVAVPVEGEIKVCSQIGLSLTYDHRIVDGAVAAGFMKTVMQLMENPARSVLE